MENEITPTVEVNDDDLLDRVAKITGVKNPPPQNPFDKKEPAGNPYDRFFEESADEFGLDPDLLRAMTDQESDFKPRAVSKKNAQGLMQLIPATAQRFGVTDPFDPKQNIRGGAKYMRWLLDRFNGNVELALAGYNAGEGAVEKYGNQIPPYRETQDYVRKIRGNYRGSGYRFKLPEFSDDDKSLLDRISKITAGAEMPDDGILNRVAKITGLSNEVEAPSAITPQVVGNGVGFVPQTVVDANAQNLAAPTDKRQKLEQERAAILNRLNVFTDQRLINKNRNRLKVVEGMIFDLDRQQKKTPIAPTSQFPPTNPSDAKQDIVTDANSLARQNEPVVGLSPRQFDENMNPIEPQQPASNQNAPVPERAVTLEAQQKAMLDRKNSSAIGVLFTDGERVPDPQYSYISEISTPDGVMHISVPKLKIWWLARNPKQEFNIESVKADIQSGKIPVTDLIGGKAKITNDTNIQTNPVSLVTTDADGNELNASVIDNQNQAQQQAELDRRRFANQEVNSQIVPSEEVVNARVENRPIAPNSTLSPQEQSDVNLLTDTRGVGEIDWNSNPATPDQMELREQFAQFLDAKGAKEATPELIAEFNNIQQLTTEAANKENRKAQKKVQSQIQPVQNVPQPQKIEPVSNSVNGATSQNSKSNSPESFRDLRESLIYSGAKNKFDARQWAEQQSNRMALAAVKGATIADVEEARKKYPANFDYTGNEKVDITVRASFLESVAAARDERMRRQFADEQRPGLIEQFYNADKRNVSEEEKRFDATIDAMLNLGEIDEKKAAELREQNRVETLRKNQEEREAIRRELTDFVTQPRSPEDYNASTRTVSEEEIDAEQRRRNLVKLSQEEIREATQVGRDVGAFGSGLIGGSGRSLSALAGIIRPFSSIGILPENWYTSLSKQASKQQLAESVNAETNPGIVSSALRIGGGLGNDVPRLLLLSRLPGGAVVGLGADAGLQSAGRGETTGQIAANTIKGGALGALFGAGSKLQTIVKNRSFMAMLPQAEREILQSGLKIAPTGKNLSIFLASRLLGEGAKIGTVGAGTYGIERLSGATPEQAFHSAITNVLTDMVMSYGGKVGDFSKIVGKVFRVWKDGKKADVTVDESGNIRQLKGEVRPDYVDAEIVVDGESYSRSEAAQNITPAGKQAPETVKSSRGNTITVRDGSKIVDSVTVPDNEIRQAISNFRAKYGDGADIRLDSSESVPDVRGNVIETSETPRELAAENPLRAEYSDPQAARVLETDKRAEKIVEALQGNQFKTVEEIAKATKFKPENVTETLLNLYQARRVEFLDNSARLISSEPIKPKAQTLTELAQQRTAPIRLSESSLPPDQRSAVEQQSPKTEIVEPQTSKAPQNILPQSEKTPEVSIEQKTAQIYENLPQQIERQAAPEKPKAQIDFADRPDLAKSLNVFTERGRKAQIEPKVIEESDLLTSLDEGYPMEFQPRDRTRTASKAQISEIANKLNPEFLGDSPKASDGRPLVVPVKMPDGKTKYAVISGNGRTQGIRVAYDLENEGSKAYREFALSKGGNGLKNPVYVGILDPQQIPDFSEFAKESNESSTAQMSASEQAKADADRLDASVLNLFVPSEDGTIHGAANRDFVRAFLDKTTSTSERNRFVDSEGKLNQEGVTRVKNAIFAKAFGNSEMGMATLQRISESTDSNIKNITNALLAKAGELSSFAEATKDSRRFKELDIAPDFSRAMEKYSELKENGISLDEYIQQGNLFGADTSPLQTRVMMVFDRYKRRTRAIRTIIDNYIQAVEAAGDPNQQGLFGDAEIPSKESIFEGAVKSYEEAHGNEEAEQTDLFDADQRRENESRARSESDRVSEEETAPQTEPGADRRLPQKSAITSATGAAPATIDSAAHEAATSPLNDLPEPTQAQKEAGNYKKGHFSISGINISIENPIDSVRSGADWKIEMKSHYGDINGTIGADGEPIDIFVKTGTPENWTGTVFVVDQVNEDGSFDEHKVMLGYDSEAEARAAYSENYTKGWKVGKITAMPFDEFKKWIAEEQKAPAAETKPDREFSSTQLDLPLDQSNKIVEFAKKLIPQNELAEDGYEEDQHFTAKFGLHTNDEKAVEKVVSNFGPVKLVLGEIDIFDSNANFDVVFIKGESADLERLNKLIADNLETTDTHKKFVIHETLAYVKKGEGAKYKGNNEFSGTEITFDALTFSGKDRRKIKIPLGEKDVRPKAANNISKAEQIKITDLTRGKKVVFSEDFDYLSANEIYEIESVSKKQIYFRRPETKSGTFLRKFQVNDAIQKGIIRFAGESSTADLDGDQIAFSRPSDNIAEIRAAYNKLPQNVLTGNEIANFQTGGDMSKFRLEAKEYARNHIEGRYNVPALGSQKVEIRRRGIKHALARYSAEDKIRAIAALPDLLRNSTLLLEESDNRNRDLTIYHLISPLKIGSNEYVAKLIVREDASGRLFYDHDLTKIEKLAVFTKSEGQSDTGGAQRASNILLQKVFSVKGNSKLDNDGILYQKPDLSPLGFFSAVEQTVIDKMPARASADQVRGLLNPQKAPGIKQEELDWLGLDEFLQGKNKIAKDELLEFIRLNNADVQEVVKNSGEARLDWDHTDYNEFENIDLQIWEAHTGKYHYTIEKQGDNEKYVIKDNGVEIDEADSLEEAKQIVADGFDSIDDTKYPDYQTEGKTDAYRELLLTLPNEAFDPNRITLKPWEDSKTDKSDIKTYRVFIDGEHKNNVSGISPEQAKENYIKNHSYALQPKNEYKSPHWDEPNILAHVRFNERTGADGNRILFVEEIQSDWGQSGRKKGFADSKKPFVVFDTQTGEEIARYADSFDARRKTEENPFQWDYDNELNAASPQNSKIPDMPFKKSWHEIALKRIFRYAAENDFDQVSWTTGNKQFERFGSERIDWRRRGDGSFTVAAKELQGGNAGGTITDEYQAEARAHELENEGLIIRTQKGLTDLFKDVFRRRNTTGENEQLAKKLWDRMNAETEGTFEPRRAGMQGFYDQILPSFANKYLKKFGAKVEADQLFTDTSWNETGFEDVHTVKITPEMKASVLENGQPLFSRPRFKSSELRKQEEDLVNELNRLMNRTVTSLANVAKIEVDKDTKLIKLNPAAGMLLRYAINEANGDDPGNFLGLYLLPHSLHSVLRQFGIFQTTLNEKGEKFAARKMGEIIKTFESNLHPYHQDLPVIITTAKTPLVEQFAGQEELLHRADFRARDFKRLSLARYQQLAGYQKAFLNVRKIYGDIDAFALHNEVIAKSGKDNAVDELGISQDEIDEIELLHLEQLAKNGVTPKSYKEHYQNISERAEKGIEKYERIFRQHESGNGENVANSGRSDGVTLRSPRNVRTGSGKQSANTITPDANRFEKLRQTELLSADRIGNERSAENSGTGAFPGRNVRATDEPERRRAEDKGRQDLTKADPREVVELSKELTGFLAAYPRPTQAEVSFWKKFVKAFIKNERQSSYKEIIINFRRAGLLTGIKTHLRNMSSNALMQASEETMRPLALLADLTASAITGRRTVGAPSLPGVGKSFLALVRADETFTTLNLDSAISRAWNILLNGDIKELKKNQLSEMSSGFPLIDKFVNTTFRLLGAEDALFKVYATRRSLEEQAKTIAATRARKISWKTPGDKLKYIRAQKLELLKNPTKEMLLEAMLYADLTTFTNDNPISDWFKKVKDVSDAGKFVLEVIVPYDKTPTNIVLRSLEHTPLGFVWSGKHLYDLKKGESYTFDNLREQFMREYEDLDGNRVAARIRVDKKFREAIEKLTEEIENAPTPDDKDILRAERDRVRKAWQTIKSKRKIKDGFREADRKEISDAFDNLFPRIEQQMFARSFGRASFGTMLLALGLYLGMKGLLSGSLDPGEKDERTEFYDRREKGVLNGSLKLGNRRYQINDTPAGKVMVMGATLWEKSQKPKSNTFSDIGKAGSDLVFEQPLLNSFDDYFGGNKSVEKRIGGLLGSFVPAMLADAADLTDPEARRNERFFDGAMNRIPGIRNLNEKAKNDREPYLQDTGNRILNKFDPFNSRPVWTPDVELDQKIRKFEKEKTLGRIPAKTLQKTAAYNLKQAEKDFAAGKISEESLNKARKAFGQF